MIQPLAGQWLLESCYGALGNFNGKHRINDTNADVSALLCCKGNTVSLLRFVDYTLRDHRHA